MTIKYIRAYMREDNSINFYEDSEDFLFYIKEKYMKSKFCLKFREINYIDENKLVAEFISEWQSEEESNICSLDQRVREEDLKRKKYNEENKIMLLYIMNKEEATA
jgi:hypothetical protein